MIKENSFLVTKLYIVLKDCFGTVIYQSSIGKSKEKEFEAAYVEALQLAFTIVYSLNYSYNENTNFSPKSGITVQSLTAVAAPLVVVPTAATPPVAVISAVNVPVVADSIPKREPKFSENSIANILYA